MQPFSAEARSQKYAAVVYLGAGLFTKHPVSALPFFILWLRDKKDEEKCGNNGDDDDNNTYDFEFLGALFWSLRIITEFIIIIAIIIIFIVILSFK